MGTAVEQLAKQAMSLLTESRARLADLLVESLDAEELGRIDQMWIVEAKRRRDEVRAGRVETIPSEKALRKVRNALKSECKAP
jgi:hypothetical protein